MAFIRQNAVPSVSVNRLVGPIAPRRRRVGAPLGAIQADPDLTRYPNGARLRTLSGYESAPDLTQYTNGRPLPTVNGNTPKAALVLMAFDHCMSKRRGNGQTLPMMSKHRSRGMNGLGDDNSDVQAISDAASAIQDNVDESANTVIDTSGVSSSQPYTGPLFISGSGPIGSIAGAPSYGTQATAGNAISNLISSLFRPSGSTVPVYSTVGSGLSSPIVPGSSVSTGGALLVGGGLLLLVMLLKKR